MDGYATVTLYPAEATLDRRLFQSVGEPHTGCASGVNDSVFGSESVYERHGVVPCLILPKPICPHIFAQHQLVPDHFQSDSGTVIFLSGMILRWNEEKHYQQGLFETKMINKNFKTHLQIHWIICTSPQMYTCTFVTLFIQSSSFLTCDNLTMAGSPILETGSHYDKIKK